MPSSDQRIRFILYTFQNFKLKKNTFSAVFILKKIIFHCFDGNVDVFIILKLYFVYFAPVILMISLRLMVNVRYLYNKTQWKVRYLVKYDILTWQLTVVQSSYFRLFAKWRVSIIFWHVVITFEKTYFVFSHHIPICKLTWYFFSALAKSSAEECCCENAKTNSCSWELF